MEEILFMREDYKDTKKLNIFRSLCFLVLATVISIVTSNTILIYDNHFNNAKMNCFIKHLKHVQLLDKDFEEFPSKSSFNVTDCENYVNVVQKFYYERIRNGSTFEVEVPDFQELLEEQGDCIVDRLHENHYSDLILKSLIFDSISELSDKLLDERKKTVADLQVVLSSAISSCTFSALYDAYIEIRRNNYCARKYVVEHDIMGLRHFNLTLNPFHINVSDVNCTEIIQNMINNAKGDDDDDEAPSHDFDVAQLLSRKYSYATRMYVF